MGVFKWGYPMRPQEKTIAEIFKSAGYATAHFGKWHLGSVRNNSPAHPGANGFDHWISAPNFFENDPILCRQGRAVQYSGESSEVTVDLALDWIKPQVEKKVPFLAVVWFGSPHAPHVASDKTKQMYEGQERKKQNFYGEVTGMDDALGKLQKNLEQMGIRDNTVLWYISDNGALPNIGSSGGLRGHKGKIYDGGLMVPSIIQWPAKFQEHRKIECRGNSCDILPTLLSIANVKYDDPLPLDGENLLPVFLGKQTSRKSPMGFWDYAIGGKSVPSNKLMAALMKAQEVEGGDLSANDASLNAARLPSQKFSKTSFPGHSAWIDGSWKLHRIEKKEGPVVFELYDLNSDPKESKNVLADHPQRVQNMTTELNRWLKSVVDSIYGNDYPKKE